MFLLYTQGGGVRFCPSHPGAPEEAPIDVLNASAARCRAPWGALEACGLAVVRRAPPGGWRGAGGDTEPLPVALLGEVLAPPPPPRTKWTRRVPHPVLIGHAASLTPY